jgi:NifB/MoaA-like Fe-S oxidoreductase
VRDLGALFPGVRSIGVVPVGLTKHRGRQPRLRRVTPKIARELVAAVEQWQQEFLKAYRSRLVFAADELYLASGAPLPSRAEYESFAQLSNGIGGARLFLEGVGRRRPPKLRCKLAVLLVTGALAAPLVEALAVKLRQGGVEAKTCVVQNRLMGRQVTTAGLLAGRDIARAVRSTGIKADLVVVPGTAVREPEGFMDSMTLQELSEHIAMPVVAAADPAEVGALLRRFAGALR